jgi:hypothetical protein
MSDDPLDKEISVSAELTPSGLNAKAKSRFFAAVDRLCGNLMELANVPMERRISKGRAEIDGEKQMIEAMTKYVVDRMGKDPEFAERAIRNRLGQSMNRQENKDGVMRHAIEDLNRNPTAEEASPELDPDFLNRFERHAEDATTEQLREKWGRVLGAEIRKPGSVTPRLMRIVDEIDAETARLFEEFCRFRLGEVVPVCLSGGLNLRASARLVGAGLLVDPGFTGQVRRFGELSDSNGRRLWFSALGRRGIGMPREFKDTGTRATDRDAPLQFDGEAPALPIYVLTDEGKALAGILDNNEDAAFNSYVAKLRTIYPELTIVAAERINDDQWRLVDLPAPRVQ